MIAAHWRGSALVAVAVLAIPVLADARTGTFTCEIDSQAPAEDASARYGYNPGYLDISCTEQGGRALDFAVRLAGFRGISDHTCRFDYQAQTEAARQFTDISCTENEPYDFQVTPKGVTVMGSTRFVVIPLSRPFGSIVIDARVDCEDGSFYRPDAEVDFISTKDATGPLDVGEIGEVYYDANHCNGAWSTITLTPRFPEWRCSGCEAYEPAP